MCPGSRSFSPQELRGGADIVKICILSSEFSYFPGFAVIMLHRVELQQDEGKAVDSSLHPPLLAYLGPSSVSEQKAEALGAYRRQ